MRSNLHLWVLALVMTPLLGFSQSLLPQVHSHNDYKQQRPFREAYEAGCGSIEVDVFLRNDTLFVAHERSEIRPEHTLSTLYLEPISQLITEGTINHLQLLIDIKTAATPTLHRLITELRKYPTLLKEPSLRFVISGNRPAPDTYTHYPDFIYFDYQSIEELDKIPLSKVALISLPFYKYSRWDGKSEFLEVDKLQIQQLIRVAHSYHLPFRLWATPDTERSWREMAEMGIDFINTDHPRACTRFFIETPRK